MFSSSQLGISTTVAVFFHEIPHEIGDFAILIQSGFSKQQAIVAQVFTALGALLGTLFGLIFGATDENSQMVSWIIPFTAGGFIYVATVNVLPELLAKSSFKLLMFEFGAIITGVACMYVIALNE
jgi:zinc transporter 7